MLTLSREAIEPGGGFEIAWRFHGDSGRIRRLRLCLEGREEATYTRDESACSDREVFFSKPLVDTTRPGEVHRGRVTATIPAEALPSFHSSHNKVAWAIHISGDIPFWPDVDDEFEITVKAPAMVGGAPSAEVQQHG